MSEKDLLEANVEMPKNETRRRYVCVVPKDMCCAEEHM